MGVLAYLSVASKWQLAGLAAVGFLFYVSMIDILIEKGTI